MSIVNDLEENLVGLTVIAERAADEHAKAVLAQISAKAQLDEVQKEILALQTAIQTIKGDPVPTQSIRREVFNQTGEFLAQQTDQQMSGPAEPSIIVPATEIPVQPAGPDVDPNSQAALEGWVKGADGRYAPPGQPRPQADIAQQEQVARAEATATGPKCGACGKRGSLVQMQHDSGRMLNLCTACNNQIW